MTVNHVHLIGRLGRDPDLRQTAGGKPVCNFSIATSEKYTDRGGEKQEKTTWHRIVAWGNSAEACARYLAKGSQVYVEGKLDERQWEDKDGNKRTTVEVIARNVQFLDGKSSGDGDRNRERPPKQGRFDPGPSMGGGPDYQGDYEDQDVPF